MLEVALKLCPDLPDKRIRFSLAFIKKSIQFVLREEGKVIALYSSSVLLPPVYDTIFQKLCSKKYALVALESSNLEIVFIFLAEVIALHK